MGHDPAHLQGVDMVVFTSALKGHHDEIDEARRRGIQVLRRAELLGELVNAKRSIGISGTHGKTTTSAMIALVLEEAGFDPTVLVGGMVRNFGGNAKRGSSDFLVVEADEYDRTFHQLHPEIAVVTNIEADHLEYYGSLDAIVEAFQVFVEGIKPGGALIGCVDDPAVKTLLGKVQGKKVVTYGMSADATVRATRIRFSGRETLFDVPGLRSFKLFVPGDHNVLNALAAIAVGRELGIAADVIAAALAKFMGVDRRFQILGQYGGAIVVDDYAHHPTEIRATLTAARRGYPKRRIVALFQPHLYSRTRDFAQEFAASLREADVAIVAPIYAARERPIEGISSRMIAEAREGIEFLDRSNREIESEMRRRLQPNDMFITMGAGDVHEIAEALVRGAA
jgi:UDP-N-acetylmuramate--alanine ligase